MPSALDGEDCRLHRTAAQEEGKVLPPTRDGLREKYCRLHRTGSRLHGTVVLADRLHWTES